MLIINILYDNMTNINIIFLDIDGVLNTIRNQDLQEENDGRMKFQHQFNFDEECMKNLKEIILKFDAYVVISSSWRIEKDKVYMSELLRNFKEYEIDNRIIDITPSFSTTRGEEIKKWLFDNKDKVSNYIILDDEDDMIELSSNLILCDDYYGFDNKAQIKAEQIFKSDNK